MEGSGVCVTCGASDVPLNDAKTCVDCAGDSEAPEADDGEASSSE